MTRDEVRKHNEREWNKKLSMESCPQSCSMRGEPHKHIYEAKLIDWNGERIPDPQYPYKLVGQVMPAV